MPELPHRGTELRSDGDGDDDEDDDGNEDSEEQEQEENDTETLRDGDSSIYHDIEGSDERYRGPVGGDSDVGLLPSLSPVRRTHSSGVPGLPQVDLSRIDIDFSFLNYPPDSSTVDLKGKGRARSPALDSERTPTSSSVEHDYFKGSSRHVLDDNPITPTRTPKSSNVPVRTALSRSASAYASGSVPPPPKQDSLPHHLSRNFDANVGLRPGMYKQASYSMIDIHAAEKKEMVEEMVRHAEQGAIVEEKERRRKSVIVIRKGKGKARESVGTGVLDPPPPSPAELVHVVDGGGLNSKRISKAPAYETGPHPLRRRRSMPSFIAISDPPPYPTFERRSNVYGLSSQLFIQPRDDEGRERLPPYSNAICLKAIVPRKMEFVASGVQAKDRKWRRVVCVLEGTALKVYRCPASVAGVSALGGWWEGKVGVGDVSSTATGNTGASGNVIAREQERQEETRIQKGGDGLEQTELPVPTATPVSSSLQQSVHPPSSSSSRSRLGLANLLKPRRAHARSTSDMLTPPRPRSPRASLNIPVDADVSELSSRSRTPTTPFSASSMTLSSHNSNSRTQSASPGQISTSSSRSPFRNAHNGNDNGSPGAELDPQPKDLIRVYTMQHAESGLGNDYLKRKHVIRVRVEGEQFLFQAKDVADVVAWIEVWMKLLVPRHQLHGCFLQGLQAAANVALDLDERPMPKGPLFPRCVLSSWFLAISG